MKTLQVAPEGSAGGYQVYLDDIEATSRYAASTLNRRICSGLIDDITMLLSPTLGYETLAKWEVGFIVADTFLDALNKRLSDVNPQYLGDAHRYTAVIDQVSALSRRFDSAVFGPVDDTQNSLLQHGDELTRQRFKMITDSYLPVLDRKIGELIELYEEKKKQIDGLESQRTPLPQAKAEAPKGLR